jgi:outer membrane protein insertion porin family
VFKTKRLLLFILILAMPSMVWAQDPLSIRQVVIENDTGERVQLSDYPELHTAAGTELSVSNLADDQKRLVESTPGLSAASARIEPIAEGEIDVIFEIQKRRTIRHVRILIEGNEEDENSIPTGLREKLSSTKGQILNARNLQLDKTVLTEHFVLQGHPHVQVTNVLKLANGGRDVDISYRVQTGGRRVLVNDVKYIGNKFFKASALSRITRTHERSWFLASKPTFKLFDLDGDMRAIVEAYRDEGFLNAQASYQYKLKNKRYAEIKIAIVEGERSLIRAIHIDGNETFNDDEIKKIIGIKEGDGHSDKKFRTAMASIRQNLGEKGYPFAEVLALYDTDLGELNLSMRENGVFKIEKIVVEGLIKMKPETLLLDVKIKVGDQVNTKKITETIEQLKRTRYYSDVQIDFRPKTAQTGELIIAVAEAKSRSIRFGGGVGSESGPFAELAFSDDNLFSTGKRLSLSLTKSREMERIGLIYQDPHLLDSDYSLRASIGLSRQERELHDEDKIKVFIGIEREIRKNLKLGLGARVEFLDIESVAQELSNLDHNLEGNAQVLGMVGTLRYSTQVLDSVGDAKSGVKISASLLPSYSGQGAYLKSFASFMGSLSLGENASGASHTLSGRITLGHTSNNTPFYERFYGGGVGTIRGFEENSLHPEGNGGTSIVSVGGEYSFPVWEDKLKGVVFLEAAAIGEDSIPTLSDFRLVGGLGARANLRNTFLGSALEAGVAIPLIKKNGDSMKPFYFIFGDYDPAYDL